MGALFNTPGTQAIIQILSATFTHNFSAAANNSALIADLGNLSIPSWRFANAYGLIATGPGSGSVNLHWRVWLEYFDKKGGDTVRSQMATALGQPNRYEAIEFFAVPDPKKFQATATDYPSSPPMYTLMVSVTTPTYDKLPP